MRFNKYIQENIAEPKAEKDANDFLKAAAICNKHSVNIDEWLFCFAKLHFSDKLEFQKFIDDYEAAVATQGKLKSINIWLNWTWIFVNVPVLVYGKFQYLLLPRIN